MSEKIPYEDVMDRIKDGVDYIADEAYQKGLEDAWECIKKIQDMPEYVRVEIFNNWSIYHIIQKHTASEAMERIKAYEEEHKQIRVGDEVKYYDGTKAIALDVSINDVWTVITENACIEEWGTDDFRKTGRHFNEVETLLEKMRESEDV